MKHSLPSDKLRCQNSSHNSEVLFKTLNPSIITLEGVFLPDIPTRSSKYLLRYPCGGIVEVDALGTWRFKVSGSAVAANGASQITVHSTNGATTTAPLDAR